MVEHNVPPFVEITMNDFIVLRAHAVGRRYLEVQFHADTMRLQNNAVNHWVFPVLASMRGLHG